MTAPRVRPTLTRRAAAGRIEKFAYEIDQLGGRAERAMAAARHD
jgi:hypothetical protein